MPFQKLENYRGMWGGEITVDQKLREFQNQSFSRKNIALALIDFNS